MATAYYNTILILTQCKYCLIINIVYAILINNQMSNCYKKCCYYIKGDFLAMTYIDSENLELCNKDIEVFITKAYTKDNNKQIVFNKEEFKDLLK